MGLKTKTTPPEYLSDEQEVAVERFAKAVARGNRDLETTLRDTCLLHPPLAYALAAKGEGADNFNDTPFTQSLSLNERFDDED